MKALFVHDHHYYRDGDDILSKGQFHNSIWQRYIDCFNHLTVVGRDGGIYEGDKEGTNIASRNHVTFSLYDDVNTLKGLLSGRKEIKAALKDLIQSHDVLILRGVSEFGILAFLEAKRQGKFIAMEVVGCCWDDMWNHGSVKAKLYAPYRFLMGKYMVKRADAAIYVSQKFLQSRYPSDAPIQAAASNVQIELGSFHDIYTIRKDRPLKVGLIGTLKNKLKGVHIALEACETLRDRGVDNFTFHLLGPGDTDAAPIYFNKTVENRGLKNIAFHDGLRESGTPVHEWLRDLDIYIQPSFQEGVPRATIEAMGQSLPAIGAKAGGIPELLPQGCIIAPGDAIALADKLEWLLGNPKTRKDLAKRNYEEAKKYTMDKLVPIRTKFWNDVRTAVEKQNTSF
jgi:glycosyltransferase involved in cell wall biosynthesis